MGRVETEVTVENLGDLSEVHRGGRRLDDVRRVQIRDALVATGATTLALPSRIIEQLGLVKLYEKQTRTARGVAPVSVYEAVRVTIHGRFCTVDVMEVPNEVPTLIGQIPLEILDLVVDPKGQRLIGNPAHDGEQILDLL